jgi:uncharacterized protein YndB with AHSA1/START domain
MSKLYVEKQVDVNASARRVWAILTEKESTIEWASEFSLGGPRLHLESNWDYGSPVLWKDQEGAVIVEGTVTAIEPGILLRYTVFNAEGPRPQASPEDGITFKLTERDGRTRVWVSQGDFSSMPEGAKYRNMSEEIWDRALARIKRLAERPVSSH